MKIRSWFVTSFSFLLLFPAPLFAQIPNDPKVEQWSYKDVGAYAAWDIATGSPNVVVAVIDNGFDTFHPDLSENVWKNTDEIPDNGVDDDTNGYIDDVWGWNFVPADYNADGTIDKTEEKGNNDPRPNILSLAFDNEEGHIVHHGTLVAGIIGAVGNNGQDGAGVNWKVKLMNLKLVGNIGSGSLAPLPAAVHYAVDNGAHVINMSLVGTPDPVIREAVKYAYDHGVAVVAAAGNDMMSLEETQRYPVCADSGEAKTYVMGVSAMHTSHRLASFSNTGASCIDITAPGVEISSAMRYAPGYNLPDTYGGPWNGTSFAAPFVSGALALVKSIQPSWGPDELYDALRKTVHKTPPSDEAEYRRLYGAGLLQIDRAVAYAKELAPVAGHTFSKLKIVAEKSSVVSARMIDGIETGQLEVPALKGADSVAFWHEGETNLIAATSYRPASGSGRTRKAAAVTVNVMHGEGAVISTWTVRANGPWQIALGDIAGGSDPEVILSPTGSTTDVWQAFTLTGQEVVRAPSVTRYTGISLAVTPRNSEGKQQVAAVYPEKGQLFLHTFTADGKISLKAPLPLIKKIPSIAVGDTDGDGKNEYVLGGGVGDEPLVTTLNADGSIVRQFDAYSPDYRGGVRVVVADENGDGQDDIVVAPVRGAQPVRVWGSDVRLRQEWWPQGEEKSGAFHIFVEN